MAILVKIEIAATADQYEELNRSIGVDSGNLPEGLISHVAAQADGAMVIVDVWESEASLQRFFEQKVGPAMQQLGIPMPEPQILPVHNRFPA